MLDDLKLIHERDPQDALGIAERQWQQFRQSLVPSPAFHTDHVYNVVYVGMGGSALPALLVSSWPVLSEPFEIVRGYDIPNYVDSDTLFIASSYSGNTEETLQAIDQAAAKNAQIVIITSGGKLADLARTQNYPLITIPKAKQARYTLPYMIKALLVLLEQVGLVSRDSITTKLEKTAGFLKQAMQPWLATAPTASNQAKQIALEVIGKSVVVYAGPKLWPAAYKWKINFNENAKQIAWANQYPEFNHNEFIGWTEQPVQKPYAVIDLRSSLEHPRIQKRFEVTERLLSGQRPAPIVIQAQGGDIVEQVLWTIALGDFVTIYTALLSGLNPTPLGLVEKFKQIMDME